MLKQKEIEILDLARERLVMKQDEFVCIAIGSAVVELGYNQPHWAFSHGLSNECCEFLDDQHTVETWLGTPCWSEINLVFRLAIIDTMIARRA